MIKYLRESFVGLRYYIFKFIYPYPKILNIFETLDFVLASNKSIARYGDGEFHMLGMSEDLGFQKIDHNLSNRLTEILSSDQKNCIIALPGGINNINGFNKVASYFWKQFYVFHYPKYYKLLDHTKVYCNASFTRPYIDFKDRSLVGDYFLKMKKLWENKKILIVEGEFSKLGVGNDLFEKAIAISRIVTLSKNAFDHYEEIFEKTKLVAADYDLILVALGPTATVLAYDMSQLGYRTLDIGHIDVEYEWYINKAETKIAINGKQVNENSYDIMENENFLDKKYHNQIIFTIKN